MNKNRRTVRLKISGEGDAYEMAARMLWQATGLRRAAEILDQARNGAAEGGNRENFSAAFFGAPILRAQSAEIALKALWYIGYGEKPDNPPRCHNLTKLHDTLTQAIQKLLAEKFLEIRVHRVHTFQYRSAKHC